ncbi:MAG: phosphotransferase [Saprospiraceae bacterium]|nr:phosphotransferase [Saprospiraceae bacterium]
MSGLPLQELSEQVGTHIKKVQPVSGGDINQAYRLETPDGKLFLKANTFPEGKSMLASEQRGLQEIQKSGCILSPKVIWRGTINDYSFLLLEFIEEREKVGNFWENFARELDCLHSNSRDAHGFDSDNYIGTLNQINNPDPSWVSFFRDQRLRVQIKMGLDKGLINSEEAKRFEKLLNSLQDILPETTPALLHGDLWAGNFLSAGENAVLIDPACYYGSPEIDLAMAKLFGGFSNSFFDSYGEMSPRPPGLSERISIYQLYYLLVHLNLFGRSYWSQIKRIIDRYQ